ADLIVGLLVHEDVTGAVVIEVLELLCLESHRVNSFACAETRLDDLPRSQTLQLRADECTPVAGIDVLKLNHSPQFTIHTNRHARPKVRRRRHTAPSGRNLPELRGITGKRYEEAGPKSRYPGPGRSPSLQIRGVIRTLIRMTDIRSALIAVA